MVDIFDFFLDFEFYDFYFLVKYNGRVGLLRKKKMYFIIGIWMDVFSIFVFVLRQENKGNSDLFEDLVIYMDFIRFF